MVRQRENLVFSSDSGDMYTRNLILRKELTIELPGTSEDDLTAKPSGAESPPSGGACLIYYDLFEDTEFTRYDLQSEPPGENREDGGAERGRKIYSVYMEKHMDGELIGGDHVFDLTGNLDEACGFIELLYNNGVTPMTLRYIAEDWLADKYGRP